MSKNLSILIHCIIALLLVNVVVHAAPYEKNVRSLGNSQLNALRPHSRQASAEDSYEDSNEDEDFEPTQQNFVEESFEGSDEDGGDYEFGDEGRRRQRRDTLEAEKENAIKIENTIEPEQADVKPGDAVSQIAESMSDVDKNKVEKPESELKPQPETEPEPEKQQQLPEQQESGSISITSESNANAPSLNRTSVLILIRDALKKVTTVLPAEQVATNALQYFQLFEHFLQQTINRVIDDYDDDEDELPSDTNKIDEATEPNSTTVKEPANVTASPELNSNSEVKDKVESTVEPTNDMKLEKPLQISMESNSTKSPEAEASTA